MEVEAEEAKFAKSGTEEKQGEIIPLYQKDMRQKILSIIFLVSMVGMNAGFLLTIFYEVEYVFFFMAALASVIISTIITEE